MKKLKNGILRVINDGKFWQLPKRRRAGERKHKGKRSEQKVTRRESRGGGWLVSRCGDGDVVDVGEVDGDGVGDREENKQESRTTDANWH